MLGHTGAAMTLDVYAGLFDAELDAVTDAMPAPVIDNVVRLQSIGSR